MFSSLCNKLAVLLEMIKFKLTVFGLPFAFMGAFLAGRGVPSLRSVLLILLATVGARTCAMTFNRIADRVFDAANPRTANRAIPAGDVKLVEAWAMIVASGALFFFACYLLNPLTLKLSPFALGLALFYSLTKRFTALCHLVLGLAHAFSALGGWVAVSGSFSGYPWVLSFGVVFWVAGFDTIYACLDADFDKTIGLYSLPSRLGPRRAFRLAGFFHLIAFLLFTSTGIWMDLNWGYYVGIVFAAAALLNQHRLVRPDDLTHIHASFFSMNGLISLVLFIATVCSLLVEKYL